jgi:hypothetical protein
MKQDYMDGTCGMHGEEQKSRRDLLEKREGKRPLGRTTSRWEEVTIVLKKHDGTKCTG